MTRLASIFPLAACALALALAGSASAAPRHGVPDSSFGNHGRSIISTPAPFGVVKGSANDGAGGTLVVSWAPAFFPEPRTLVLVTRIRSDGSLDQAFADQGFARFDIDATQTPNAIAVQPSGRILIGDGEHLYGLTPAGSPDSGFGTGGRVDLPLGSSYGIPSLDASGRILLGGYAAESGSANSDYGVLRLTADGAIDPAFGENGMVSGAFEHPRPGVYAANHTAAAAFDREGRAYAIVCFGSYLPRGEDTSATRVRVLRLTDRGGIDPAFGGPSGVLLRHGSKPVHACPNSLVVDRRSRPLIGVRSSYERIGYAVTRLRAANGALDRTLSGDGTVAAGSPDVGYGPDAIALDRRGRLVALTAQQPSPNEYKTVRVSRLLPNGSRDLAFGDKGKAVVRFGEVPPEPASLSLDPSGRAYVTGSLRQPGVFSGPTDVFAVRLTR